MFTLKNDSVLSSWNIDLEDYNETESFLPLNSFNLRNDSSQIAYVDLDGRKVGEIQRYSSDSFMGRPFSIFTVYNPNGNEFAINELFVQVSKDQVMSSQPFNPQWDMLEDDFDRYATGCNNRISFSSSIPADAIKYWVNTQNKLIVQRKIDVLGGAAVGSYEINFGGGDVVAGSTAIDFPTVDPKRYRKTILDCAFDYTLTDCTIKGWNIDLKLNDLNISDTFIQEEGGATAPNSIDTDLTSFAGDYGSDYGAVNASMLEFSFPSIDIDRACNLFFATMNSGAGGSAGVYFEYYDGSWHTLSSHVIGGSTSWSDWLAYNGKDLALTNVTGFRIRKYSNGGNARVTVLKAYDISAFV